MIFENARCPVQSCKQNHGDGGCSCGFAGYGDPCSHPRHKLEWWERTGGIVPSVDAGDGEILRDSCIEFQGNDLQNFRNFDPEPEPACSLTARASRATRAAVEMTTAEAASRALQLAMEFDNG